MHRRVDDPEILPPFVRRHSVAVDLHDATSDLDAAFPGVALPEGAAAWGRKRRVEVLAGRWCAREALRALALPEADAPLGVGPSRAPRWPPGVVGSITHTQGFAAAAVADAQALRGLGIDSEERFTPERAQRLDGHLAHPGEVAALARALGVEEAVAATLVFSMKESVFKCLHPLVDCAFGFRAARVEADSAERVVIALTEGLGGDFGAGRRLAGRFAVGAAHVHTAVALPWPGAGDGW